MMRVNVAVGIVAAIGLLAPVAGAQEQHGNALDANFQVGGGGYNAPVPGGGPINSQLYVTGQVTGLAGFHGFVGYAAPEELRIPVPSASLSAFQRESVGLSQVLAGATYDTTPYFDASRTAFGVRGITGGLTAPGTNVPVHGAVSLALTRRLYNEVTAEYGSLVPSTAGLAISAMPQLASPVVPEAQRAAFGELVYRPGAEARLSILRAEEQEQLARELYRWGHQDYRVDERVASEADAAGRVVPEATDRAEPTQSPQDGQGERSETLRPRPAAAGMAEPDQDALLDLLIRLRQQRATGTEPRSQAGETDMEGSLPGAESSAEPDRASPPGSRLIEQEYEQSPIVIHGLAGLSPDAFNQRMTDAEKKLRDAKYYDAADSYEVAIFIEPANPMARIGAGLARFAAGEPRSSAIQFHRAMQLLPPIMETRIDILGMLPEKVVEYQVGRLDERLAGEPEASLAFLSAFLHESLGEQAKAADAAARLQTLAREDKLMQAYAKYILTGERPTTQPAP